MTINELPPGHWLHFDETVEVPCDEDHEHMRGEHFVSGCSRCGSTTHIPGVKRVRVHGAVAPIITTNVIDHKTIVYACLMHEGVSYCKVEVEAKHHMSDPMQCKDSLVIQQPLTDAVITAFLADKLPGDVADHIEQEDVA